MHTCTEREKAAIGGLFIFPWILFISFVPMQMFSITQFEYSVANLCDDIASEIRHWEVLSENYYTFSEHFFGQRAISNNEFVLHIRLCFYARFFSFWIYIWHLFASGINEFIIFFEESAIQLHLNSKEATSIRVIYCHYNIMNKLRERNSFRDKRVQTQHTN